MSHAEHLARRCQPKAYQQAVKTGRVKGSIFWSGPYPLEISVDRADHSDAVATARAQGREVVYVRAGDTRRAVPEAWVIPDKPPSEHALILLSLRSAPLQRFADKETELKLHATAWSEFSEICDRLAANATPTRKK